MMAPLMLPPHNATVSISSAPGAVSAHGSQRTATSRCIAASALLARRRLRPPLRYGAISRSICAALMFSRRLCWTPGSVP